MRQLYKDIVIGFILASFVYTPGAFAKPRSPRVKSTSNKSAKPLYTNLERTIRSNKKGLKVSKFVTSAQPMVKKREFRDLKKMFLPFWDKTFDKMVVGQDYFVVDFKGQKIFGRYVDRGPIAFIVNGKPFLWKDMLIYGKAKRRMMEIMGMDTSKNRKVSIHEFLMDQFFPQAFAVTKDLCAKTKGAKFTPDPKGDPNAGDCQCPDGLEFRRDGGCQVVTTPALSCANKPGTIPNEDGTKCYCESGIQWSAEEGCEAGPLVGKEPAKKKSSMGMWLLIGAALLLFLLLMMKKKKKKPSTPPVVNPPVVDPPIPGWTPEPEGQCPTPGARGITEADLPPECRKSTCSDTNSCTPSSGGAIY